MMTDPQRYAALTARDARFDGVFFVGVKSTGIYCRPVCRARTPKETGCEYFDYAAQAEAKAYRACFLCRPETAPHPVATGDTLAARAIAAIDAGADDLEALALQLDITSRHLRRVIDDATGLAPVDLVQSRRLALAKNLLHDSALDMTEIAFAAGFQSLRRFNAAFRETFQMAPTAFKRQALSAAAKPDGGRVPLTEHQAKAAGARRRDEPRAADKKSNTNGASSRAKPPSLALRLGYRAPFDWVRLLRFLDARAMKGVEHISDGVYRRTVRHGDIMGWLEVRDDSAAHALRVSASWSLAPIVAPLLVKLRALFDLDASPAHIHDVLDRQKRIGSRTRPGLRVPGSFEFFEIVARAILGQQVSVKGATTLAGRFVVRFGEALRDSHDPHLTHFAPRPEVVAAASVADIQALGLPASRAATLRDAARVAVETATLGPKAGLQRLASVKGIGPWTLSYLEMRLGQNPDAFPSADLVLRKALGTGDDAEKAERLVEPCKPWRAYAALHLWTTYGEAQ